MLWWFPQFMVGFGLGYLVCKIQQWLAPPEDGFVPPPKDKWPPENP